jgi:gluconokinase
MVVIIMGVSGSGKTTIGKRLAAELGWRFLDADDFHSPANIERMRRGEPLDDREREPWLRAMAGALAEAVSHQQNVVLACSALKTAYRAKLREGAPGAKFVLLHGDPALIASRMRARPAHFMPPALLASQLATLEEPSDGLAIDVSLSPDEIVRRIREELGLDGARN